MKTLIVSAVVSFLVAFSVFITEPVQSKEPKPVEDIVITVDQAIVTEQRVAVLDYRRPVSYTVRSVIFVEPANQKQAGVVSDIDKVPIYTV